MEWTVLDELGKRFESFRVSRTRLLVRKSNSRADTGTMVHEGWLSKKGSLEKPAHGDHRLERI